jgi:hypothetical protein
MKFLYNSKNLFKSSYYLTGAAKSIVQQPEWTSKNFQKLSIKKSHEQVKKQGLRF